MTSDIVPNISLILTVTASPLIQNSNSSEANANDALQLARFICLQILMPIVCIIGVTGNVLNIVVLTTATMRSSTSCYLCAVAVSDLLYSLNGLTLTPRPFFENSTVYMNALTFFLPLGNMWSNITAWLTCTFTIERFMAISTPIRSRKNFSIRRTQWNITFVCLLIALITLPDFFEHKAKIDCKDSSQEAVNCSRKIYILEKTKFSKTMDDFGWPYARVALFVFFPLIILAIFNALLIKSVIKAHHERNKMLAASVKFKCERGRKTLQTSSLNPPNTRKELAWRKWWITRQYYQQNSIRTSPFSTQAQADTSSDDNTYNTPTSVGTVATTSGEFTTNTFQSKPLETTYCFRCRKRDVPHKHDASIIYRTSHQDKQSITITLIAVVVVFCILNFPSAVVHLLQTWFANKDPRLKIFGNVSNLFLMINAAVNFFLYSLFSARFRRSFRILLKRHRC